jgi:hypothetical protein
MLVRDLAQLIVSKAAGDDAVMTREIERQRLQLAVETAATPADIRSIMAGANIHYPDPT